MRKIALKTIILLFSFSFLIFANAEEKNVNENETELNFFTGMFDFSDTTQASGLIGVQHQNDELFRESFLGKISPITGGFLTLTPSFAPGYYSYGNGKDLGSALEFKSEIQLSLDLLNNSEFGFSYNHISNASLGEKNPGANSYMFNFLKNF